MQLLARLVIPCALALALIGAGPALALPLFELTLADNQASAEIVIEDGPVLVDWSVGGSLFVTQTLAVWGLDARWDMEYSADTNGFVDDRVDTLTLGYKSDLMEDDEFALLISLTLRGGLNDPRQSDIAETIELFNPSDQPISFTQTVELHFDGEFVWLDPDIVSNIIFTDGVIIFEEAVNPAPDFGEGDGNAFYLEWEVAPGETLLLSKDKRLLTPEPSAGALTGLGLLGLAWAGRQRRA